LPTPEDLREARAQSSWDQIQFGPGGVTKSLSSTRVDVDGIAKGYAIDRALEVLQRSGARGGMVEVGGDLRLFGEGPEGGLWTLAIRSPFEDRPWAELELQEGAVCSSGDYARYLEIGGRRFSHIVDPRTGWPTEATHAVTVVGQDAVTADAWATALSVLGVPGLPLLDQQEGLQAMVVTGGPDDYTVHATPGFRQILRRAAFTLSE
jgi:thiamine biosynthesis lipoprotein